MATSKKFSELPAASSVGNGDLFAIAHEDALAETGYVSQKLTAAQAGQKVNGDTEYPTSLPSFPENGQNPFAALEKLNADIESLYPVNTASGSIANFTTSLVKPLTELTSTIVATQAGTGTPSPQNVRSISGVSSVKFVQTGKNLFDKNNLIDGKAISSDGSITDANYAKLTDYIPITNGQCTFSAIRLAGTAGLRLGLYDENKNFISRMVGSQGATGSLSVATVNNSNVKFVRANLFITSEDVDTAQVEQGTTATSYEAYTGDTFTIALGQTVYGGSVDAKSGKARVTWDKTTLSNVTVAKESTCQHTYRITNVYRNFSSGNYNVIAEKLATYTQGHSTGSNISTLEQGHDWTIFINANSATLFIVTDSNYDNVSASDFKIEFADLLLVFEAYEVVEITGLTPDNFTTFAGENNIFSDCGEVTVGFKQGIQEYIDAKIAETQALIL